MQVPKALHMNGGIGENSYANNSFFQQKVLELAMPIIKQAVKNLCCTSFPTTMCIADLGCSLGSNTFLVIAEIITTVDTIHKKLGSNKSPEFQVYFNDLPHNDFNNLFLSLPEFEETLRTRLGPDFGPCFFNGSPRSFYDRLFATNSVHFIHSSCSLHWLSKVPDLVDINKGNIYLANTSPSSVLKAYYEQFEIDFSKFLDHRAQEMVLGGCMVLTLEGRTREDASTKEGGYFYELFARVLNQLVLQGLIEAEKVHSFNLPYYTPSTKEIEYLVQKEGSFTIDRLEVTKLNWNHNDELFSAHESNNAGERMAKCLRSVLEPMLVSHFGETIMDEVFKRYGKTLDDCMAKEVNYFVNITISMIKKGKVGFD